VVEHFAVKTLEKHFGVKTLTILEKTFEMCVKTLKNIWVAIFESKNIEKIWGEYFSKNIENNCGDTNFHKKIFFVQENL
jgi:hypothetical protein